MAATEQVGRRNAVVLAGADVAGGPARRVARESGEDEETTEELLIQVVGKDWGEKTETKKMSLSFRVADVKKPLISVNWPLGPGLKDLRTCPLGSGPSNL